MKKLLALTLALFCFLGLVACADETENAETTTSESDIQQVETLSQEEFDISVSYANYSQYNGCLNADKMSISSVQHLPIWKFDTLAEMKQFKQNNNGFTFERGHDEIPSFNDTVAKYDDDFFEDNSLILVYVSANSGSYRYGVNSVFCDGAALCVHVERKNDPEIVTCDMAGWFVTVAVPDSIIENCTEFDADLNNIEN